MKRGKRFVPVGLDVSYRIGKHNVPFFDLPKTCPFQLGADRPDFRISKSLCLHSFWKVRRQWNSLRQIIFTVRRDREHPAGPQHPGCFTGGHLPIDDVMNNIHRIDKSERSIAEWQQLCSPEHRQYATIH